MHVIVHETSRLQFAHYIDRSNQTLQMRRRREKRMRKLPRVMKRAEGGRKMTKRHSRSEQWSPYQQRWLLEASKDLGSRKKQSDHKPDRELVNSDCYICNYNKQ